MPKVLTHQPGGHSHRLQAKEMKTCKAVGGGGARWMFLWLSLEQFLFCRKEPLLG